MVQNNQVRTSNSALAESPFCRSRQHGRGAAQALRADAAKGVAAKLYFNCNSLCGALQHSLIMKCPGMRHGMLFLGKKTSVLRPNSFIAPKFYLQREAPNMGCGINLQSHLVRKK